MRRRFWLTFAPDSGIIALLNSATEQTVTTIAQLIAKLQTMPQDAEVQVMGEDVRGWDLSTEYRAVDLDDITKYDYSDFESRMKYPKMAGRVIVEIRAV
jgi:hypothetical protein